MSPPSLSLPKGGGAIRGLGEKLGATPFTGTGSMSVPIATSPARSGFGPELALRYDSGAGNGPFGFGWSLALPSITRRTDQGLPRYDDANESDVFILSGSEDLVPVPRPVGAVDAPGYEVRRYRPRIEGLFARIERWTAVGTGEIHWRSISRDNVTTFYGLDNESRVFDPADPDPAHPTRIFAWLICQSYDDKGNAIVYDYRAEDSAEIDGSQAHERNRDAVTRSAQRCLKAIKYGNRVSRLVNPDLTAAEWLFEVVFDYGEGRIELEPLDADGRQTVRAHRDSTRPWRVRSDPFSTHRAAFEVRSYRLCERALVFHHFPEELGRDDTLVSSTDFDYDRGPSGSFLTGVTQCGYVAWPDADGPADRFLRRSLPPLELEYSKAVLSDEVRALDRETLDNLPGGTDPLRHQWVDLDGEGLPGFLTEEGDALYYKRNLGQGRFGPIERLARIPAAHRLGGGGQQLLDLAGDGGLDLVDLSGGTPGFYARTEDEDWEAHRPFASLPRIDWTSPDLRFVDLTGDGRADVLITEDCAFRWHPSLADAGFGPEERTSPPLDEERGPRLVFADGTESIYLADLSGDGLSDLVRIRNGEVSYWPNLGYGRFGARVTMDDSPHFDPPDLFDQRQIRLADVDGSGTTDIIYLRRGRATLYRNLSGNAWSAGEVIEAFPTVDDLTTVAVTDLFGAGTACLVWSSTLPGDARRPVRYVDLMAEGKPHLLVATRNNLGATTRIEYAAATKFYLRDRAAGDRWITKLPFPVHVVERVTVEDFWRGTSFSSTYSYHHGYFDGYEREFRGFARIEQVDVESFGRFAAANARSPYVTEDRTLYQPPIKTITWSHTGVALGRERILTHLASEYFPHSAARLPGAPAIDTVFAEKSLPEPDLGADDLTPEEWREALRACKGMTLRQEIYELDVVELERTGAHVPVRLFSAATHNCNVRRLQPRGANRHAVFLVTESEALTYHYELDLRPSPPGTPLAPDPRIAHTLNLSFDDLGNAIQSVAVGYPRTRAHQDAALAAIGKIGLVRAVQNELHLAYTETSYTNDVPANPAQAAPTDDYRLRVPFEVQTFELTGFAPAEGRYFDLAELRAYRLSDAAIPGQGTGAVISMPYHDLTRGAPTRRLVEHARTLFLKDDLTGPLALGALGRLGLTYERYKLALTDELLNAIFTAGRLAQAVPAGGGSARALLADARASGYLGGTAATDRFGPQATGQYWMRSGLAGFASDAADRFYLPRQYADPFERETRLVYDTKYQHFIQSSTDARGNTTRVVSFDYRVLAPLELEDANGNRTEVRFDALGRVIALALKGKGAEADDLIGYDEAFANPGLSRTLTFFDLPQLTEPQARARFAPILGNATSRFLYHFGETRNAAGNPVWLARPAGACAVMRERHAATIAPGDPASPLQIAFECSDGGGGVLMKRAQAEPAQPGGPLRWIVSGKTVVNNKGKPVKQYEPYFSGAATCRGEGDTQEEVGVTPLLYYDAAGRLVRTEMPDGTFSRVEFSPWHVTTYDAGDTAYDPDPGKRSDWYDRRTDPAHPRYAEFNDTDELRAALSSQMHADTPSRTIVDSLGRDVVRIEHNRYADSPGVIRDERYLTFTRLDSEGKPLWIRDARGNLVMQYVVPARPNDDPGDAFPDDLVPCYDIAGNLLYQHSMDAGDRWTLLDAAGQPMLAWDFNTRTLDDGSTLSENRRFQTRYDELHRPAEQWLAINTGAASLVEAFSYTDTKTFVSPAGVINQAALDAARAGNLVGQATRHYDPSGLATVERIDFKGAPEESTRTLLRDVAAAVVDWKNVANRATLLEDDTFIRITEHDALGRMTTLYNWHRDTAGQPGNSDRVAVYVPAYNARGALESEMLHVRATKHPGPDGRPSFQPDADARRNVQAIGSVTWNAKGQKVALALGNGTTTRYDYDPESFRLRHLYTRRGAGFAGDCAGNPDATRPARPCGVQNLHYTYDPSGNVTHVQDDSQDTIWFANQQVEPSADYTYDALYRLIESTGRENDAAAGAPPPAEGEWPTGQFPSGAATRNYRQIYRYDSVGNFTSVQHVAPGFPGRPDGSWTRSYKYAFDDTNQPAGNRLWQTRVGTDPPVTYRPDDHGNMLNLDSTAPGQDVRWDWRDMIRALDLEGGGDAFYNYGIDKQRTRKLLRRNGGSEDRLYLAGYELYTRTNAAGVVELIESHHLFEGDQRVLLVDDVLVARTTAQPGPNRLSIREQTLFRYQYGNHLGSVGLELDADAAVISYEEYHPYGTTAFRLLDPGLEVPAKRHRYTGMERDEESGLNYHGARYCAPTLGRWLSIDPIPSINGFLYCRNAPTILVDLDGNWETKTVQRTATPPVPPANPPLATPERAQELQDALEKTNRPDTSLQAVFNYDPYTGEYFPGFEQRARPLPEEPPPATDTPLPPTPFDDDELDIEIEPRPRKTTKIDIKEIPKEKLKVEFESQAKPTPKKKDTPKTPEPPENPSPPVKTEEQGGGSVKGTVKDQLPPTYEAPILFKSTDPWHPVATFADPSYVGHVAVVTGILTGDPSLEVTIEGSVGYAAGLQKELYEALGADFGPLKDARAGKVRDELIDAGVSPERIHISRGSEGFGPENRTVHFKFWRK